MQPPHVNALEVHSFLKEREKRKPTNVLVVLNEREKSLFFPKELRSRLGVHSPEKKWVEPPQTFESWHALLVEKDPDVIVGAWSLPPISDETLELCPRLRYICLLTGSFRHRISRSFFEQGRMLSNWGDAAAPMVAECALALTLACLRQINRFAMELHVDRDWQRPGDPPSRSLFRRTVGLHGFGAVARHLLPLLSPFQVKIQAWSEPVPDHIFCEHGVEKASSLEALFSENDIVIDVEALTPLTEGVVSKRIINSLKPGAVFVNVGRGGLIDEEALAERARVGDITVGLDVYRKEPLPVESPLRGLRNVVLLPHTAGPTLDNYPLIAQNALANLELYLAGGVPPDARNLNDYDRST